MNGTKKKIQRLSELFKSTSLASQMWYVIITALGIFGVAFVLSIFIITGQVRRDSEIRESETLINSVAGNIIAGIDNYKDISRMIMLNEDVIYFMNAEKVDAGTKNDAKFGIMDVLNVATGLDSVFIFRNDGGYTSTGRAEYNVSFTLMDDPGWQSVILDRRGKAVVVMNANDAIHRKNGSEMITVARAIYDIYSQKRTGILLMNVSTKMLESIVNVQGKEGLAILSSDGKELAGDEELVKYYEPVQSGSSILHRYKDGKMISLYRVPDMPLIVVCSTAPGRLAIPANYMIVMGLLLLAFTLSILMAASIVTRKINKPISELANAMEETKNAGWLKKIDIEAPVDEIKTLADSYNSVIEYLNDLFTRLIDNEKAVQRAEMRVLQEQIKPHFLYNSLSTISYMAYEAGADEVYNALETLGNFYRNFLNKGDREISVRREINIIKDYLSLQKLRYGDIIEDEYDVDEAVLDKRIPKLLLQPIVENCIYHGIRPKGEKGIIKVSALLDGDYVRVSVYDDGVGMTPEEIEMAMAGESPEEMENGHSGFGLRGTIDRIRYFCDREDVVFIESEVGEYTRITFLIPCNTNH
ncbi:MAG: sensor histidine kinase [Lachnospiraceae bacterium]|nr:sensor histidine kinase [Lachnospiraceae bacterium]